MPRAPAVDRPVPWRRLAVLGLLAPGAWALQVLCALDPVTTDSVYSRGIFPPVRDVLTAISGWMPFSLGEVLLLSGIAFVVFRVVRGLQSWRAGVRSFRNLAGHAVGQSAAAFGVLFLVFQLVWGLNHSREPFAAHIGLDVREVEPSVLARVTRLLAERAEQRRPDPPPGEDAEWQDAVLAAYDRMAGEWDVLAGPHPTIRFPWISRLLTWSSLTGIYSPYTAEPHVNGDLPVVMKPFIALHEIAHHRGFAREDEANFIAWWVGWRSPDPLVAYSCELMAYRIALGRLYAVDGKAALEIHAGAPPGVAADVAAIRAFWHGQPKVVREVFTTVATATNDAYLRSSGHEAGVRSYGRMVDLLIAALAD